VAGFAKRVVLDRAVGERPSGPRALGAALVIGTMAGVLAYRLLRREGAGS
jgi:hypothetical protein